MRGERLAHRTRRGRRCSGRAGGRRAGEWDAGFTTQCTKIRREPSGAEMSANASGSPCSPSFVVVGSCIVDFCVSVARLPGRGETVLADSVTRSLGGKGANQAAALRRLGGEGAIVGSAGCAHFA